MLASRLRAGRKVGPRCDEFILPEAKLLNRTDRPTPMPGEADVKYLDGDLRRPSILEEATVPLRSRPETATTAAISIEANEQSALGDIGAFEAPVQREGFKDEEILPAAPVRTAERPANQPVPAAPVPASPPSFAAYQPATPRESIFRRLKTNLPLEQFLGMNLFAKVGIVLLVLGLALLGRMALIARGRVCVWRSLTE